MRALKCSFAAPVKQKFRKLQETYGEDPFLTGSMSVSYVQGLQGRHPRYVLTSSGCKAFDAYNGPENIPVSRFTFDAKVRCVFTVWPFYVCSHHYW